MVLSLLLVMFVRFTFSILELDFNEIHFFSLYPFIADDPTQIHRFLTSAWLHADWIHVLSNILVNMPRPLFFDSFSKLSNPKSAPIPCALSNFSVALVCSLIKNMM